MCNKIEEEEWVREAFEAQGKHFRSDIEIEAKFKADQIILGASIFKFGGQSQMEIISVVIWKLSSVRLVKLSKPSLCSKSIRFALFHESHLKGILLETYF